MTHGQLPDILLERFVRYAATGTQSNRAKADAGILPSSACQLEFAQDLSRELHDIGLADIELDTNGYILARIPASPGLENKPCFGLCAHMDTASDAPGDNVKPQIHHTWNGKPIRLDAGFTLDPAADPELAGCVGHTIITSDGSTLLGADDKAGIAGIVTLAAFLLSNPEIRHGPIEFLFSPDEETGHGMDNVPLSKLKSKAFYTVDGGQEGEIEAECFNAWKTELTFSGVSAHLGSARGKMVNAVSMAAAFVSSLPAQESPEATDGYFGYFCPLEILGSVEETRLTVFTRDFNLAHMKQRLARLDVIARSIEASFTGGKIDIRHTQQYLNMKEKLDAAPEVLALLRTACERAHITAFQKPIRGGTDGSRLTELGIPTPNIFTGGHNYHSRTEWASLEQMTSMIHTLIELAQLWGE